MFFRSFPPCPPLVTPPQFFLVFPKSFYPQFLSFFFSVSHKIHSFPLLFIFCFLTHCLVSLPPPFLPSPHSFYSLVPIHCLLGPASRSTLGRDLMMQKCSSALQELHDGLWEQEGSTHTRIKKNTNADTYKHGHSGAAAKAQLQMYSHMPVRTCQGQVVTRTWPVCHTGGKEERVI